MAKVFQVFAKSAVIAKPAYDQHSRAQFYNWPKDFHSQSGYLEDDTLNLPEDVASQIVNTPSAIVLMDHVTWEIHSEKKSVLAFNAQNIKLNPVLIKTNTSKGIQLHSQLEDLSHFTEVPQKENHLIGILKENGPIRYMTNNRWDFSATQRRQRQFLLHDYIIEYKGEYSSIKYHKQLEIKKRIPLTDCKVVDERRILN